MTPGSEPAKYTLWLMPDKRSALSLRSVISSLAATFGTIPFDPHVTLASLPALPERRLIELTRDIAARLNPFTSELKQPICGDPPFHRFCCEAGPEKSYLMAAETADQALGGKYARKDFYHISLLYGDTSCTGIEREFDKLRGKLPIELHIQFIALYRTSGPVDKWREVCFFDLST
jgi:hypothetical protein